MKKLLSIIVLFAALGSQLIAQNIMSLSSAEGSPQDIVEIELYVTNIDDFIAFQTEIPLGDNLTYVENSAVLYRSEEHQLIASVVNGILKIYSYSFSSSAFSGNEGKVASFQLKLGNEPGNFVLENTKAKLVDVSAEELPLSTTNGNLKVITPKVHILTPELNFGHIPIRNTYTRSLTVKNIGNAPMTITGLLFSNESLSCPSFTEKVVSAGYSTSFTIQYAPQIAGAVTYDITVVSDASSGNHKAKVISDPYSVNELHLDQTSGYCDSIIDYNISINNMDAITGFQFCVKMPTALQYQEGSIELSSRMNDHIGFASMRNDTLIVGAYSVTNASFTGNEGVIASLKIKIKGNSGYHYLHPNNVIITNADADNVVSDYYYGYVSVRAPRISANATHELSPSSVTESISSVYGIYNNGNAPLRIDSVKFNDDYLFTTTEFPLVINDYQSANLNISCNKDSEGEIKGTMRIYSNDPISGLLMVKVLGSRYEPNELQIDNEDITSMKYLDVLVNLDNYSELTAIQADFSFPSEYYTLSNSDVKLTERCSGFSKTAVAVNDSTFKILVFSMSNDIIAGNEGTVLKIKLMRKDGAQNENATVSLKNIVLSDVKGNNKNSGGDKIKAIKLLSTHSKELKEGWNWYSTYIDIEGNIGLDQMKNALGNKAKQIKDQLDFVTYEQSQWFGTLEIASSEKMYMIEMNEAATVELSGVVLEPLGCPIKVKTNWNWIGYLVNSYMSINEALSNIDAHHGDYFKSQLEFSQYYEGTGWLGALDTLEPGMGYMYKNNSGKEFAFVYPASSNKGESHRNVTVDKNHWNVDAIRYPTNMSVIARISNIESKYEVAAFVNGECRGSSKSIYLETLDETFVFLTIYGKEEENITFKFYDELTDVECNTTAEMKYRSDETIGTLDEPFVLTLREKIIEDDIDSEIDVYPNPTSVNTKISLNKKCEKVEIYNVLGIKIAEYENVNKIDGIDKVGVYLVKIIDKGKVRKIKIIIN